MEPRAFRFAPEDEAHVTPAAVAARLERDFVIGAFNTEDSLMIGVGGLAWNDGVKTRHKALLYGMYVKAADRGSHAADDIMKRLIEEARARVEIVTLTVVATNLRALRFYERWGFRAYGVEERSAKNGDGEYLDETLMALRLKEAD
ncbi:MAG TPA: GNAT family N-acetyltransferase [Methylocystis sp.]